MSRSVTTFIIIPPLELAQQIAASKARFEGFLSQKFPGYEFNVSEYMDFGADDDFVVLPMMNYIDEGGISRMCEKPSREFIEDVIAMCWKIDLLSQITAVQ